MRYTQRFVEENARGTSASAEIILPQLKQYLVAAHGMRVLDIGCGSGLFARQFASHGAEVVGVDQSREQIEKAQELAEHGQNVQFICSNITDAPGLVRDYFDVALLIFVMLDLSSGDQLISLIEKAFDCLAPDGKLIIGDIHPHNIDRFNEVEEATLAPGSSYFDIAAPFESRARLASGERVTFRPNYHFPLEFLIEAIVEAGFALYKLRELGPDRAKFPTHLIIEAGKKSSGQNDVRAH